METTGLATWQQWAQVVLWVQACRQARLMEAKSMSFCDLKKSWWQSWVLWKSVCLLESKPMEGSVRFSLAFPSASSSLSFIHVCSYLLFRNNLSITFSRKLFNNNPVRRQQNLYPLLPLACRLQSTHWLSTLRDFLLGVCGNRCFYIRMEGDLKKTEYKFINPTFDIWQNFCFCPRSSGKVWIYLKQFL